MRGAAFTERKSRPWRERHAKAQVAPRRRLRSAVELAAVDPVALHPALHLHARLAQHAGGGRNVAAALTESSDDLLAAPAVRLRQALRAGEAERRWLRQAGRNRGRQVAHLDGAFARQDDRSL